MSETSKTFTPDELADSFTDISRRVQHISDNVNIASLELSLEPGTKETYDQELAIADQLAREINLAMRNYFRRLRRERHGA